eukprot:9706588-Ditylum_brightwellii.AAC.1
MTERENIKTNPNCVTRDVTVWENITKEKERESFVTIMICVTMAQISTTLCRATGSMFSPYTVSRNNRGSSSPSLSRIPKGGPKSMA